MRHLRDRRGRYAGSTASQKQGFGGIFVFMAKKQSTGPVQGPAPVYKVRDPKPPTGAAKGAQTRAAKVAGARREAFENSDTVVPGSGIETASGRARMASPIQPGIHPATVYRHEGYTDNARHPEGQQTLPGMGSLAEGRQTGMVEHGHGTLPDTVPVARWHHLSNGEKMSVEAHAASFGVTRSSARQAFAANLDQAYHNAPGGQPAARDFYSDQSAHMPAGHIVQAAKDSGRSVSAIATATSITSPQTEWGPTVDGHYPNIRAARQAAIHTGPAEKVEHPRLSDTDPRKVGTFTGNVVKAVGAVRQMEEGNTLAADLKGEAGKPMFGGPTQQKTTAFRNALVDPEGPHASLVSDVHTGGRGFAPHLSPEEAGAYLKHPGVHQWHDHIAREVMRERGLQSINHVQAAQWGQAQLDSGQVKTPAPAIPAAQVPGQGDLFSTRVHRTEEPSWSQGQQFKHEATVAKRRRTGTMPAVDSAARAQGW